MERTMQVKRKMYDWYRLLQGAMEMPHELVKFADDPYVNREITERHPIFAAVVKGSEVLLERYKECEDLTFRGVMDEAVGEVPRPAYLYQKLNDDLTDKLNSLSEETKKITGMACDQELLQFFELLWTKQWWEDKALALHQKMAGHSRLEIRLCWLTEKRA